MTDQSKTLIELVADMKEEEAIKLADEMLDAGYDPVKLLDHCREAMEIVYFSSSLISSELSVTPLPLFEAGCPAVRNVRRLRPQQ